MPYLLRLLRIPERIEIDLIAPVPQQVLPLFELEQIPFEFTHSLRA
jgi:hypothetical protein